jgi:hypothetical protein
MAQIQTTGGGTSYTADGKKLTKQVYVLTAGETSVTPIPVAGATITSADFVTDAAGVTRVTVTWTQGLDSAGGSGSAGGGASTELIGGAREIPTEAHPTFKSSVSDASLKEIKAAIQDGRDPDTALVPTTSGNKARILYKLLLRGQEYYLAPAVSYRQTTIETSLPALRELCTVNAPQRAPGVGGRQNWLLSSINARSVAQPTGVVRYEVTREWMLSDRNGWDPEKVIYNGS